MIMVKHFKEERVTEAPRWKAVEKFLNEEGPDRKILHITGYPTGPDHNLIVIYEETEVPA
jgi:hypothetical protein